MVTDLSISDLRKHGWFLFRLQSTHLKSDLYPIDRLASNSLVRLPKTLDLLSWEIIQRLNHVGDF